MIPVEAFWALILIDGGLILYAFLDSRNRLYGNIAAIGIAAMLSFLLGMMVTGGGVGTISPVIYQTTTAGATTYSYTTQEIPMQNSALGYFLVFVGVICAIFTGYFAIDAMREMQEYKVYEKGREENLWD